jgi:hypothetical protein
MVLLLKDSFEKFGLIAEARKGGNAESREKQSLQNNSAPSVLPRFRD